MPHRDAQVVIRDFRRNQIITTAMRLFGASGSVDVPLDEIAAEAGVSRSTIYNHFRDRAELLSACAEWSYSNLAASMQKALDRDVSARDLVSGFFEAAFRCLDENPGFYRVATNLRAGSSEAEAVLDSQLHKASAASSEQVAALVDRLVADRNVVTDGDATRSFVGLVLAGSLQRRASLEHPEAPAVAAAELAHRVLFGLTS